jgi:hypothetical protein
MRVPTKKPRGPRTLAFVATFALAGLSLLGNAWTIAAGAATTTTLPPPPLLAGVTVEGAAVHSPGAPDRSLDANQATAFMQSWLPDSVFQKIPQSLPPKSLPFSRVIVTTRFHGQNLPVTVFYASDGTTAWIGMPAQSFGWAIVQSEKWIAAPQGKRVMAAFQGRLQPVRSPPPAPTTTTTTLPPKHSSSGSAVPWLLLGGAVVVAVGALAAWRMRAPGRRPKVEAESP